jgi:hypothetical protein
VARWCQEGRTGVEFPLPFRPEAASDGERRNRLGSTDEYLLEAQDVKSLAAGTVSFS